MGIDGIILCDCLETGSAVPPPFPLVRELWYFKPAPGFESRDDEIATWLQTACAHERATLLEHKVRAGELLEAMADHGGEAAFPAIHAALPQYNGDEPLTPDDATRCLAELDRLNELLGPGTMAAVVDTDRGTVLYATRAVELVGFPRRTQPLTHISVDHDGAIHGLTPAPGTPLTTTWLGADGVVRVKDTDGMVLFESREFTQDRADQDWTFGDVATGQTLLHCSPIVWPWLNDAPAHDAPRRLRAEIRPVDITYCMKGVSRLRELFETSVRLGRPVFWE